MDFYKRNNKSIKERKMGLNKHLDSDEKMVHDFRPSRRAFIHTYIFYIAVISACIYFEVMFRDNLYFEILFGLIAVFPLIGIIKNEWMIISSRYALTNERIFYSKGIFTEDFRSFHYYAITDIKLSQSLWDKIVNTGNISINTGGTDYYEMTFVKIASPIDVKKRISDLTPKKMHVGINHPKK